MPVIPRPTVAAPPTVPTRQTFTFFILEVQISHLAAVKPANVVTLVEIELPQKSTRTALPAPCRLHRPKASRAHLTHSLNPENKLYSLQ